MTSRERVLRALDHREADRLPVDLGGTVVTCLDRAAHEKLLRHLGLPGDPGPTIDYSMGTTAPGEALMLRVGADVRRVAMNVLPPDISGGTYRDGFGMVLRRAEPHDYFDIVRHPLAEAEVSDLNGMAMPDADDARLYFGLRDRARELYDYSPYAVFADFGVPGFFEVSQKLLGYERFFCDLMLDTPFLFALWDRLYELQTRFFKNYLSAVAPYAFAVGYADDLGMQDRPQISPKTYRETLKPYHKKIFAFIHEYGVKVMLHSCGAIEPLIPDLIDAGVDILNPVQTSAAGMDARLLKERYGDRLTFWGGIDEQRVLPRGSETEVRAEVKRVAEALMPGGGYVLAPAHNLQSDTPPGNILAMYDEATRMT